MGVYVAAGTVRLLSLISEDYHCASVSYPVGSSVSSILLSEWPRLSVTLTQWSLHFLTIISYPLEGMWVHVDTDPPLSHLTHTKSATEVSNYFSLRYIL